MNKEVYKYRAYHGVVTYNVISGEFGVDSTIHLQDTSCNHSGPKCEIEVVKCDDDDCYQFSAALNWTAEEYSYVHEGEKFWATKEEAYIETLQSAFVSNLKTIDEYEKKIVEFKEKLSGMETKEINYFTPDMAKLGANCFIESYGASRIIGTILFENGKTGYLTDNNYTDDRCDVYVGDRIILVVDKSGKIKTEGGGAVYVSYEDFENLKVNNQIKQHNKSIDRYKKSINNIKLENEIYKRIFDNKESLTFEEMFAIRNGEK